MSDNNIIEPSDVERSALSDVVRDYIFDLEQRLAEKDEVLERYKNANNDWATRYCDDNKEIDRLKKELDEIKTPNNYQVLLSKSEYVLLETFLRDYKSRIDRAVEQLLVAQQQMKYAMELRSDTGMHCLTTLAKVETAIKILTEGE
jgi:hypothetical protein